MSLTTIAMLAFYGNDFTDVKIPNSVKTIGERAFWETSLTSVIIPDSVTSVGSYAFHANGLTSVELPFGSKLPKTLFQDGANITYRTSLQPK